MEFVKPLDPYTLLPVDEEYRDRVAGVKGHAIQAAAISAPMSEIAHVIDFFLGDGSPGSAQNPADLEQLRKAIQASVGGAVDGWIIADVTYTIGSAGGDNYATIIEAMAYLKTWLIADGATVTLSLRAEVHAMAANIIIDHPMSHKIQIIGAAMAGAVPAVGDFAATGNSPAEIIADNVTNIAMLRTRYSTEIAFTGAFGFVINTPLGLLKDVLIVGDGSLATGITVQNEARIVSNVVSVHGFGQVGIDMNTAHCLISGGCLTVSGAGSDGISVRNGSSLDAMNATALIAVSVGLNGLAVKFGSTMRAADGVTRSMGCISSGLQVSDVSSVSAVGAVIRDCQEGVSVARNSHVYMRNASSRYNETYGVYVDAHSAVDITGGTYTTNSSPTSDVLVTSQSFAAASGITGRISPAANTTGNHNSRIRT